MNPTTCHPMTAYNAKQTAKALRLLLRLGASLSLRPIPAHFLLGFVQFAVRFLPDYIASY